MRACVDIGGTKTLVAQVDDQTNVIQQSRFSTPKSYHKLLDAIAAELNKLKTDCVTVVGAPGLINRTAGQVTAFGNLPWKNVKLKDDLETRTGHRIYVENDANLAALGEYKCLDVHEAAHQILYITISTGIGTGIITDGRLDPDHIDSEGGEMLIEFEGKLVTWEKVASGKSIVATYHKTAGEIDDPKTWESISHWLALGIINLLSVLSPDVIIIGGGVGTHFERYKVPLFAEMNRLKPDLINIPPVQQARNPELAVILGAAELSRQLDCAQRH